MFSTIRCDTNYYYTLWSLTLRKTYNLDFETPWPTLEIYYDEFLATRMDELLVLKNAFNSSNYKVADEFAHKWKGFANPYGFGVLGQQACLLEDFLEVHDYDSCKIIIDEMDTYLRSKTKK